MAPVDPAKQAAATIAVAKAAGLKITYAEAMLLNGNQLIPFVQLSQVPLSRPSPKYE